MHRSQLFVPATDAAQVEQALSGAADSVILDLEDTVTHESKAAARDMAVDVLRATPPKPLHVRVNSVESRYVVDDITTLVHGAAERLQRLWIPKAEAPEQVAHVDWLLGHLEDAAGLDRGHVRLLVLVETAVGLERLSSIGAASDRIEQLGFGVADLSSDLTLQWPGDGSEQLYVRSRLAVCSRAAGLSRPIDSVWPRLDDSDGLVADCRAAKALGFSGKFALDESQLDVIHEVFSPTASEVERARDLLDSFDMAERDGVAALQLPNGEFVDYAFLERARATLETAQRLGLTHD